VTNPLTKNLTVPIPTRSVEQAYPSSVPRMASSLNRVRHPSPSPAQLLDERAQLDASARPKGNVHRPQISRADADSAQVEQARRIAAQSTGSARDSEVIAAIAVSLEAARTLLREQGTLLATLADHVGVLAGNVS
jgi:hypothetical protein